MLLPALLLHAALCLSPAAQEGPPGMRLVRGGPTTIGSKVADVERWILEDPGQAGVLAGEAPQHVVDVANFHLMVTEVTNEQYAAYVAATGAMPPFYWAAAAVEAARQDFLLEEARRQPEAVERRTWDPARWWERHWTEHDWRVPPDRLAMPVVDVSYSEALAYARWAGLRLPDERELARACRGDTARIWPWGDRWNVEACNSVYREPLGARAVGSFPEGAVGGIFDLVGNVWEWTASPYVPFEGYAPITVTKRERRRAFEIEALAPFDVQDRVVVGGSYLQSELGVRAATRRGKAPDDREAFIGFRCAASTAPGRDAARSVIDEEIVQQVLPSGVELAPDRTAILQRWSSEAGTTGVGGYAVVTGHEQVLFCPVRSLPAATRITLWRESTEHGPALLGFLSSDARISAPPLEPGTYLVAWRGPGKLREYDPLVSVPGIDPEASCFVFMDTAGLPVAAMPAGEARFERIQERTRVERRPDGTLSFSLAIPGERREGFLVELVLAPGPGAIDAGWR